MKKKTYKNATHKLGYIYSNERIKGIEIGHAEISSTRTTGRASRQNKLSGQLLIKNLANFMHTMK